ncbi:KxYKxGKxW signal peptide domain-containing protein [Ligilactobacillus salivarius]|uniref:KxYKxGKxW signal peptide domain-containing protein n=1 Tax=Ligilactobacillus salivarius TaxID=1624 RepID=A0ABD7YUT8_9LACO|nr:N-acetylmuramoyl-L-alanine amidase [Ligilactobacillus salivarius]WHS05651.1 KxYKxGKxW signal peptide domain-containing protein [Ligilactobacillus salivarius]WHS08275.1 KxYKxGKxW signal peptide domain-containing protein [Ligilactobacillus salivarius]WHS09560.1 KxYKxGKxW signal peptide domain-containing protein [Ligilactobacillus salivarius]WHS13500.1 KxYKxGKxW signal peptide domain-containing protein [Ligilactobacillus salivarius]WHS17882.1 KxYKxGKxW signal peptide domain-containing protein 
MERKTHYKMYKAGKNWVFAMLSTIALTGVMAMSGNTAKADTVAQSTTEQVAKVNTTSATTTSTQATTQVEKAANTTNESNAAQTLATTTTEQSSSNADATSSSQNNKQATTTSVATSQSTSVANKDQASSTQSSTTQKGEEPKVETPVNIADNASQKYVNDNWYLVDNNTGKNLTGFQEIKDQNKVVYYAPSNAQMQFGWQNINNNKYYFDNVSGAMTTGQKYIKGNWYLFDNQGVMQTGFQKIANQNKTAYYNKEGQMQFGQKYVDNHWYLFDEVTGAMQTGFQKIANQNKTVYYNKKGQMQFGQQTVGNNSYLFDKVTGAMQTGFQNLAPYGQNKVVYYASNGQMQHGQKYVDNHWYLFDEATGAMQTGFQNLAPYGQNKTVYYASNGQMQFGQKYINNHWYLFDRTTGEMAIGFTNIPDQNKTVYYSEDKSKLGQMQFGWQDLNNGRYYLDTVTGAVQKGQKNIGGYWYNFDKVTGKMSVGFTHLTDQNKTVYYSEDKAKLGQMLFGFQTISGKTYYFDKVQGTVATGEKKIDNHMYLFDSKGVMQVGFHDLDGGKRTVYYSEAKSNYGQMLYGNQVINGKNYYFDTTTGAMRKGTLVFDKTNHTLSYVTNEGLVAKNMKYKINNVEYAFNVAGVLEHLQGEANIAGNWYLFDNNNHVLIGFQTLKDGRKVYYSPNNAQMQYGQQNIDGHWYLFDKVNGSMQTGFKDLTPYGQNKTVYYASNGQMQYGKQNIDGHWYLFNNVDGAMYKGWLMSGNDWYYYNQQNGQLQTGSAVINGVGYNFDGNGKQILNYSIDYRYALPAGKGDDETAANNYLILHDVGVESGAATNARYFHDTVDTNEAYVTFVVGDGGKVYQVGRPGQVSWGAGRVANHNAPVQIELGRTYNSGQFWQDYVTYVRLARDMAGKYGIPLTLDAGGAGTRGIKSHYWVTKNIWGDHVDPYGYLSRFGVTQAKLTHDLLYGV